MTASRESAAQNQAAAVNWWSISDIEFVNQYASLATGTQDQQSQFAWMLFARVNQQVTFGTEGQKVSQWELWASNLDTFSPNAPVFHRSNKIRRQPHLQPIQQFRLAPPRLAFTPTNPFPNAGEEVTRNDISYSYMESKKLRSIAGLSNYLAGGGKIDFPLGAVETKAIWKKGALDGAYQFSSATQQVVSLTALHLMVKIKPTPSQPFTDNSPSWFWTTFEFKSNPGLAAAQKFITYGNTLNANDTHKLLSDSGLANTPFVNYVSNGEQTQFSDQSHPQIILGNTQLEGFLASPQSHDPTQWTSWSTSCHSCHAQASARTMGTNLTFFTFTGPTGPLTGPNLPSTGYQSLDFIWSFTHAQ